MEGDVAVSADNGIYILKTKDQYRVIHAQAIENIYWSHIDRKMRRYPVSTRLVEYFGSTRYTRNLDKVMKVASAMSKDYGTLEYGIQVISVDKTWKRIVHEAKKYAPLEIEAVKKSGNSDSWIELQIEKLKRIVSY